MPRILISNDDGIFSEGIVALAEAVAPLGDILVVAPDREQSASGHSLTLHRPLRIREVRENWYAVDGTPTDCVNVALQSLFKETPPDLVISGINFGPNLGNDVTYSGTVSVAFEAHLQKLPAVAFSQELAKGFSFAAGAQLAHELLAELLQEPLPPGLMLNVNIPAQRPIKGIALTRLCRRYYDQSVVEKRDPRGRKYYWIAGVPVWESEPGTDHAALVAGKVSVTPLQLDLTDYDGLERFEPLIGRMGERLAGSDATLTEVAGS